MVRMRVGFLSAFMLFLLVFPGATMAARAEISGVDVVLHKDGAEEVRFLTRGVTPNHYFLLDHPDRLVIDLPTATATGMALPDTYKGKLIKNLRFGQFNKTHSRIVIDLAGPTAVSKFAKGSPLTVTLTPTTRAAATAAVAPAPASENGSGFFGFLGGKDSATDAAASNEPCNAARNNNCVAKAPAVSKQAADKSGAAPAAAPPPPTAKPNIAKSPVPAPQVKSAKAKPKAKPASAKEGTGKAVTPPKQDAAKQAPVAANKPKPLIVIDAGHGGQDPGATGLHNTHERDVTLAFAQSLAKALEASGRYRAMLTRGDDIYIHLPERVEIARRAHADMFISLHADSNPVASAHGLSIYSLSETASDAESAALAEHENKADVISGMNLNTTDKDVANILIDLTQRETMSKSSRLADAIVKKLDHHIHQLPKTHRFAGFRVLKGPDLPSVLIELGFLSNATDEKLLLSESYRTRVVGSIIKGIDKYYAAQ